MQTAPFFEDLARGPAGGMTHWIVAKDGVRLRAGHWPLEGAKGTVLLFTGRTEYIEKYGITATELAQLGLATATMDWRGQGLSNRALPDRLIGHVGQFADYQHDAQAFFEYAAAMNLPKPWYILGHSMGGCIALRSVINQAPVAGVIFTAPMWGIQMSSLLRPVAWSVSWAADKVALGHLLVPSTTRRPYTENSPFLGNALTTDSDMYAYMRAQTEAHPDLGLGGPSLNWLNQALRETLALASIPCPDVPALCFLGSLESIVEPHEIRRRMRTWKNGTLIDVQNGQHEVLMETPEIRSIVMAEIGAFVARTHVSEPA
ncbi:alpha/beta hydrolase [Donghicola sp. C2-DW-16]|uniref:Alpha/beta hydrolase n=2 Tax=Donghicola mangrovi TaxID=2729614 RepID=A0ABX2PI46_9RHOB|nr:alpha/beta hydrolase [Donghicola mangrovi]